MSLAEGDHAYNGHHAIRCNNIVVQDPYLSREDTWASGVVARCVSPSREGRGVVLLMSEMFLSCPIESAHSPPAQYRKLATRNMSLTPRTENDQKSAEYDCIGDSLLHPSEARY